MVVTCEGPTPHRDFSHFNSKDEIGLYLWTKFQYRIYELTVRTIGRYLIAKSDLKPLAFVLD